jgi:hypothetical protein
LKKRLAVRKPKNFGPRAMGVVTARAHGPVNQSFFASFCSQKEVLFFLFP